MSSPAEVEELQDAWDAKVESDQTKKVQVRWVPHGSSFKPFFDGKFDDPLSLWLLRKTCAAYSVVPQDLGLTMDVNRASGDTQMDIQERIADRPLALHIDGVLTAYLQDDLGLPVKMLTSLSAEKEDRKTEAEAWAIYIDKGMASADEGRQKILGLEIDNERPVPRMFMNPRTGPIPLASLFEIAGKIDPETAAPAEDVPLGDQQFEGAGATLPDKLPGGTQFKRAPVNPDDPNFPGNEKLLPETGVITPPRQVPTPATAAAPAVAPPATAVRKDANKALIAAGLVVRAADTGRILMVQRNLDASDPAAGTWEWPGGHIEGTESAWETACREWQEETGCTLPDGKGAGTWSTGIYQGFVWEIASESDLELNLQDGRVLNPDDPDHDAIEVAAWFEPGHVRSMPALRPECLLADWEILGDWSPIRKAETAGVTSDTGMVGYDFAGEAPDDEDDEEDPADVQKELRRWRDNARGRIKAGKRPRAFVSELIPAGRAARIHAALEGASTREQVDVAFVRKAKTPSRTSHEVSAAVLAQLAPDLHELRQVTRQLEDARRELHDRDILETVKKAATPAPVHIRNEITVPVQKPADIKVTVESPPTPVAKAEAPVIHVDVHVPEQKPPDVHVAAPHVEVHNDIKPEPKAKKTRFRRNPDGSTTVERED
jgi:8-oxo-dGTP pyrophosphatase MutT (NUDIX family)